MFNRLWDISQMMIGDLPNQFHFLYAFFTFILSVVLIFCLAAPFILLIRVFMRWFR